MVAQWCPHRPRPRPRGPHEEEGAKQVTLLIIGIVVYAIGVLFMLGLTAYQWRGDVLGIVFVALPMSVLWPAVIPMLVGAVIAKRAIEHERRKRP